MEMNFGLFTLYGTLEMWVCLALFLSFFSGSLSRSIEFSGKLIDLGKSMTSLVSFILACVILSKIIVTLL